MTIKPSIMQIVLTFALHFLCVSAFGQDPRKNLCEVQLRPSLARVQKELEHQYGKPVKCHLLPGLYAQTQRWGINEVVSDGTKQGTPSITIDAAVGTPEDEIAHELLHLQILVRFGIRGSKPEFEDDAPPFWMDVQEYLNVTRMLVDALDHVFMYPKLRKMGFDPDKQNRDSLQRSLARYGHPRWDSLSLTDRAFRYAGDATEIKDLILMKQLEDSMKKAGWNDSLKLGQQLRDSMEKADLTTLKGKGDEAVKDLKMLYGSKLHVRWQYRDSLLYLVTMH